METGRVYCIEEVYMRNIPGIGIWFDTEPDYSRLFKTFEEAEDYCRKYNEEVDDEVYLQPHLMSKGDMERMYEEWEI